MACLPRLLLRTVYILVIGFLWISVLYSTNVLLVSPLWISLSRRSNFSISWEDLASSVASTPQSPTAHGLVKRAARGTSFITQSLSLELQPVDKPTYPPTDVDSRSALMAAKSAFYSSESVLDHGLGHREPIRIDEKTMLAKAFAGSMRPSNVIPYFYRAQAHLDEEEVTITTLITSNRFEVFKRLVEKYQGPISVTVHIKDIQEHVSAVLDLLHDMYTSTPLMATYVDVHLVVDNFDRQFNTWRNIARMFARTEYVMMLDIDFYPCTDFRGLLKKVPEVETGLNRTMLDLVNDGKAALVIPAFEYRDFDAGTKFQSFPSNKSALVSLARKKKLNMFHGFWAPGHNSTEYDRFYAAKPGEVYKVSQYQSAYEPYIIFKRDGPPWCDERFVGYGGNKAACLFEMYLAGMSYYVVTDHFIIHQNHLYEEAARRNERKYNRKVYADFREETCVRYLKFYHDSRKIGTELARNAVVECKKIKSVARTKKYFRDQGRG